ncbi:MAG: hypothetical protein M3285_01010 [Actinomycetota bacterium]|nr:hypothetical protein [Actinomycetota bacterium]MDQ3954115.1 hypothetical protein [Actinomycetota bacterium]
MKSTLTFDHCSVAVSQEQREIFESDVQLIFAVLDDLRDERGIPGYRATVVLCDDLAAEVSQRDSRLAALQAEAGSDVQQFTVERIGGVVTGKNLPLSEDCSEIALVFDSRFWQGPVDDTLARARGIGVIAHELAHPLISRSLHRAGLLDMTWRVPYTREQIVEFVSVTLFEEYQADVVSDVTLGAIAKVETETGERGATIWDVYGQDMEAALVEVLAETYPAWPNRVHRYRVGEEDLGAMFRNTNQDILGTLMCMIHAETASRRSRDEDLLASRPLRDIAGARLYLEDEWPGFYQALRESPILPTPEEMPAAIRAAISAGDALMTSIWKQLGLEAETVDDGSVYVYVD